MKFLTEIDEKWQKAWKAAKIFEADPQEGKKKVFVTFPFPYINGPLHVGHVFAASRVDAYARFKRMQGYNVLFPWAWHWTGQPLVGASERVAKGDKNLIRVLREVDGVPQEELERFSDPIHMARFYTDESRVAAKRIGFSVDWRREFNTIMPAFQRFVEWQYDNLRKKGYVTRGTHPVVWCPSCKSPTGDHDRQEGVGVRAEEYSLVKFRLNQETYIPAATFRPETIYGATNIWIHPDETYVEVKVDNESWIASRLASEKLREQGRAVQISREFKGKEIVGIECESPITQTNLPILPGWFVKPDHATGVVYSVPAHAPYDWLALRSLQKQPEKLRKLGIDPEVVKSIKPISMIEVEGFGEYPAVEIVERLKVKDEHDPKADEATKIIYKKEFHTGTLKGNCMEYAGKGVHEAKEALINDFRNRGTIDSMYDLPQNVICRCMTRCIVKILQDQWFLRYSDPKWKEDARRALSKMKIYPPSATQWFFTVIDWLKEWACARRTGLGTPLPWEPGWIVETLSDSTVYMAFYTINKHITELNLEPKKLTNEVFDYLFLGEGDLDEIASKSEMKSETLRQMREEFEYWYPVDLRVSGKELVPNHLTFFIFQHVAMFQPHHWPLAIGVNGMLKVEGEQMHKSKGNSITARAAIDQYGADPTRCALMLGAEGMDDPDWRSPNLKDMQDKLFSLFNFIDDMIRNATGGDHGRMESWLLSALQHRVHDVEHNIEKMRMRTALEIALFETWNDFRWYIQRRGSTATVPVEALSIWLKLLAPFAPHVCEELWSRLEEGFISSAEWPEVKDERASILIEEEERLVKGVVEDTLNILKATKIAPKRIVYYVASPWKWEAYSRTLEDSMSGQVKLSDTMAQLVQRRELAGRMKEVASFAQKAIKEIEATPEERKRDLLEIQRLDEERIVAGAKNFLSGRFRAEIDVYGEDDEECYDPKKRARTSAPFRPAIYVE